MFSNHTLAVEHREITASDDIDALTMVSLALSFIALPM